MHTAIEKLLAALEPLLESVKIKFDQASKELLSKALGDVDLSDAEIRKCLDRANLVDAIHSTLFESQITEIRSVSIGIAAILFPRNPAATFDQLKYALSQEYRDEVHARELIQSDRRGGYRASLNQLKEAGLKTFARILKGKILEVNHKDHSAIKRRADTPEEDGPSPDSLPPRTPGRKSFVKVTK